MRKIILIVFALVFANRISAQVVETDARELLTLGFKVGTNYSNVYDEVGQDFVANPKFGLVAGGFIGIPIGKYLGIQPEILYSRKGFMATGAFEGSSYSLTRTTTYIDVPIYFTFKPVESITLMAGPQYSYLTKQRDVFSNSFISQTQQQEFENDNLRRNVLSFAIGGDINIDHLVLGAKMCADVQRNNGDGSAAIPRYKNVWYQLTIGYRLYADWQS